MKNFWNEEYTPISTRLDNVILGMISKYYKHNTYANCKEEGYRYIMSVYDPQWLLYRFYTCIDRYNNFDDPFECCVSQIVENDLADHVHDEKFPYDFWGE